MIVRQTLFDTPMAGGESHTEIIDLTTYDKNVKIGLLIASDKNSEPDGVKLYNCWDETGTNAVLYDVKTYTGGGIGGQAMVLNINRDGVEENCDSPFLKLVYKNNGDEPQGVFGISIIITVLHADWTY